MQLKNICENYFCEVSITVSQKKVHKFGKFSIVMINLSDSV